MTSFYGPKTYREQGGDKVVVVSGGEIEVRTGGLVDNQAGSDVNQAGKITVVSGGEIEVQSGATLDIQTGASFALPGELGKGYIPLDISSLREIATNAIQNLAAHGGILASDSQPDIARVNGATDKALRVTWATDEVDEVQFPSVGLPPDMDTAVDWTIHLMVDKDGNTDTAANIDVQVFAGVGDTEMGGATPAITETAPAEKTVTITAANTPVLPTFINISLVPSAHANDVMYLYAAWIEYTKLTSA